MTIKFTITLIHEKMRAKPQMVVQTLRLIPENQVKPLFK